MSKLQMSLRPRGACAMSWPFDVAWAVPVKFNSSPVVGQMINRPSNVGCSKVLPPIWRRFAFQISVGGTHLTDSTLYIVLYFA
jgi:hypothetical protein